MLCSGTEPLFAEQTEHRNAAGTAAVTVLSAAASSAAAISATANPAAALSRNGDAALHNGVHCIVSVRSVETLSHTEKWNGVVEIVCTRSVFSPSLAQLVER